MVDKNLRVENPANKSMHYGEFTTGVLTPPDKLPKYKLYSYREGEQIYAQMQTDLYEGSKKAHPNKKGLPAVLKILFAGILTVVTISALKHGITKLINHFRH